MTEDTPKPMKRRPPGAGSISRTRDRLQVRVPLSNQRRRTIGMFRLDEEDRAEELLHAAVEELASSPAAAVGGITNRAFGGRWLDERELEGDVRDIRNERSRFDLHIGPTALGALPVHATTALDVKFWYRELCSKVAAGTRGNGKRKLSRKTRGEAVRLLKAMFEAACSPEHGSIITENPAAWIVVKRELRTEDPWDYLREHEIPTLRACEEIPEADRLIMLFAITTGLRLGEQMNLHLVDLVVDGPHPEVVVRYGSKGKPPKNGRIRRVPLFGLGLEVARRWLELLPTYARKNPLRLVFPTTTGARRQPGKHLHGSRWNREKKKQIKVDRFKEHLRAAGITRPIRWHDLRHTCASMLVSGSWGRAWTLAEIGEHLGHVSRTSTERYAHLADTALRRAARETDAAGGTTWTNASTATSATATATTASAQSATAAPSASATPAVAATPSTAAWATAASAASPATSATTHQTPSSPHSAFLSADEGCTTAAPLDASIVQLLEMIAVGRQGLEPWTYGLKAPGDAQGYHELGPDGSRSAAIDVLRALVRGDAEAARAGGRELALEVLRSRAVTLALEVLHGGEFIDQRIASLCEHVLDAGDVAARKRGAA